jgi:hypothetical protein
MLGFKVKGGLLKYHAADKINPPCFSYWSDKGGLNFCRFRKGLIDMSLAIFTEDGYLEKIILSKSNT